MVFGSEIQFKSRGFSDIRDITAEVADIVHRAGIKNGLVNISVIGSTASVSTIEYEPALVEDVQAQLEKMVPHNMPTRHGSTWGDDNGFSHIRATLMGPGITLPIADGNLVLGTWQQIIILDHDNRPRNRRVYVQVIGE